MHYPWDESVAAFRLAAIGFGRTVRTVGDRWEQPGLGEWDIRALVGHTSRSFLTIEAYLAQPATQIDVDGPAAYYRAIRSMTAGPGVAQRGREAGRALGPDPSAAVAEIATRVRALVNTKDGSELLTTLVGGMRLADYLPTRTFELAVHTADLSRALGISTGPMPPLVAGSTLRLVADIAIGDERAAELLLAVTGRGAAPGFSIL